ncbi:MAG: serine hydrolase [Clostridiales bacterium]|nr:serine hydrolase [Clostridiales bacterium]
MMPKTQMERMIHNSYSNIGGLIVRKKGESEYEKYFNDCTESTALNVFSVTKSIVAILLGIAMDKGYPINIGQKILEFFPEYEVARGERLIQSIRLRDMLTMTAPYKYKNESAPYKKYFESKDWIKAALDLLGGKGKVGDFFYAALIGPDIFSGILEKVTGRSVLEFATKNLFTPLGISPKVVKTFQGQEDHKEFLKSRQENVWVAGPSGVNTAGWGLTMTANDLAKIGQLFLEKGRYQGQQIVSSDWVSECTTVHSHCKEFKMGYGYLWWIIDEKEHCYAAMGDSGNVIYINESKELVIAMNALYKPGAMDRRKLIREYIEPVFI